MPPVRTPRGARGRGRGAKGENPIITRSGRGSKSARGGKSDVTPKVFAIQNNTNLTPARKATRSASNVSTYSSVEIYAEFDGKTLSVHGLKSSFLASLAKRVKPVTPVKKRQPAYRRDPDLLLPLYSDDDDIESSDESEDDVSSPPQPAPTRGRGGGRARGGRGRGSRGRGAGRGRGRGRGGGGMGAASAPAKDVSPLRNRLMRNAAPMFPLVEEDDDEPSNQASPVEYAKELNPPNEEMLEDEVSTADENEEQEQLQNKLQTNSNTPMDSPPLGSKPLPAALSKVMRSVPRISLPRKSGSQTPQEAAPTLAALPVRKLLNPEDDVLLDSDLPDPWIEGLDEPIRAECEDYADYLLQSRYKPMTDVQGIINSLTKYPVYERSTENLYRLAENTQKILKAWQDEYLKLDAKTAPHAHPPKKPANGGRIPVAQQIFEDMKEADLYGYVFDPKKPPGTQDPFGQRVGREKANGRELRQRRARDMLDSAAASEEDEEEDGEGRGSKRQRRATRKFENGGEGSGTGAVTGTTTPKRNGWGGARKRGVSKYSQGISETEEPESRLAKRPKGISSATLHQRIQALREESAVASSSDEGGSKDANSEDLSDAQGLNDLYRRRGRPAGSKNNGRRSDFGIKKGPRKKGNEVAPTATPAQTAEVAPAMLQSFSQGQGQFSIDPQPSTHAQLGIVGSVPTSTPPVLAPQPNATGFPTMLQPPETGAYSTHSSSAALDAYMNALPLDGNPYDLSGDSGNTPSGRKGKPRVKSEKRSQSMTAWWAERKARQKDLDEQNGVVSKPGSMKSGTSTGKRGGKAAAAAAAIAPNQQEQTHRLSIPGPSPMDGYQGQQQPPQSFSVASPNAAYSAAQSPQSYPPPPQSHPPPPPPQQMMMQSPLAAPTSGPPMPPHSQAPPHAHHPNMSYGPPPGYSQGPPPPHSYGPPVPPPGSYQHPQPPPGYMFGPPLPQQSQAPPPSQPSSQPQSQGPPGSRRSMPDLAPAPPLLPHTPKNYPSPYGPRTAPRSKSSGPPPLAPAPSYGPTHSGQPSNAYPSSGHAQSSHTYAYGQASPGAYGQGSPNGLGSGHGLPLHVSPYAPMGPGPAYKSLMPQSPVQHQSNQQQQQQQQQSEERREEVRPGN